MRLSDNLRGRGTRRRGTSRSRGDSQPAACRHRERRRRRAALLGVRQARRPERSECPRARPDAARAMSPTRRAIARRSVIRTDGRVERRRELRAPVIGLRVLQEMVALLDEHGARLADAEKRRFSAPVLRWYADAVSRPDPKTNAGPNTIGEAPVTTTPVNSPAAPPPRPAAKPEPASPETRSGANAPATPAPTSPTPPEPEPPARPPKPALVVIAPDLRKACNGTGRRVFLLNKTDMSITATVTIARDAPGESKPPSGSSSYVVAPGGSWELGCTASPDGGAVRYELNYWK